MRGQYVYLAFTILAVVLLYFRGTARIRILILLSSVGLLGFYGLELPSIHCIVEGFFSRLDLAFLKQEMIIKLAIVFVPTLVWGRVFCGWICPKGAVQELAFIRKKKLKVPKRLDAVLRYIPYFSFVVIFVFPFFFSYRLWSDLDPFLWLFQWHGHLPGLILLALLLPLSFFLDRPFCRYLCPMAPIFRLMALFSLKRRSSDMGLCMGCKSGANACDFDVITMPEGEKRCDFHPSECLQCGICRDSCPKDAIR